MTTSIARDDLVKFLEATGHVPRIEPVAGAAAGRLRPIAIGRALTHVIGEHCRVPGAGPAGRQARNT